MGAFETIVMVMADMNLFHLFFPWLLVLGVTYGILNKHGVISEEESVNGVIALSVAFLTIGGAAVFIPEGMFTHLAAALAFGIFGLIGLLLLMAVAGFDITQFSEEKYSIPFIGALVIGIVTFIGVLAARLDLGAMMSGVENGFQEVVMPILILIFLLIVVAITAGGD